MKSFPTSSKTLSMVSFEIVYLKSSSNGWKNVIISFSQGTDSSGNAQIIPKVPCGVNTRYISFTASSFANQWKQWAARTTSTLESGKALWMNKKKAKIYNCYKVGEQTSKFLYFHTFQPLNLTLLCIKPPKVYTFTLPDFQHFFPSTSPFLRYFHNLSIHSCT